MSNYKTRLDILINDVVAINAEIFKTCVRLAPAGLKLEFGVYAGTSINIIASETKDIVYGFDSFTGLPESWNGMPIGTFSTDGHLPEVKENVKLIKGLFQDTLDDFLKEHDENVGFCHIDSDLYSSAAFVLDRLKNRFCDGTILIFDELANYQDYENHEYKAFLEFLDYSKFDFKFLGRISQWSYALILKPKNQTYFHYKI